MVNAERLETNYHTKQLSNHFTNQGFKNPLLTDSCTRALEIAAYCLELRPNDEVIIPSYGYVSTADVFAKTGAKLVFADSMVSHPNIGLETIEPLVSANTKAIVLIHYGGFGYDIKNIKSFCDNNNIALIEDNAHGIGASYKGKALGTFGHFSATSFHETKNIHCFSGGLLSVNDDRFTEKAKRYFYKGTNREAFKKGTVAYYEWTSHGNSCEMNTLSTAFLHHQIGLLEEVNQKRLEIWNAYQKAFEGKEWNFIADGITEKSTLPIIMDFNKQTLNQVQGDVSAKNSHNAHVYPICLNNETERTLFQKQLSEHGIQAYTHYHSLNKTKFGKQYGEFKTPNADKFTNGLLRLPIYPDLDFERVIDVINNI